MSFAVTGYLKSYLRELREMETCKTRIAELRAQCERLTGRGADGMPSGHGSGGAADSQLAALADLTAEYEMKVKAASTRCADVERFINALPNATHREMLLAIYIRGEQIKALPSRFDRSAEWCRYKRIDAILAAEKLYKETFPDGAE